MLPVDVSFIAPKIYKPGCSLMVGNFSYQLSQPSAQLDILKKKKIQSLAFSFSTNDFQPRELSSEVWNIFQCLFLTTVPYQPIFLGDLCLCPCSILLASFSASASSPSLYLGKIVLQPSPRLLPPVYKVPHKADGCFCECPPWLMP